jgi:hypothetical protein
MMIYSYKRDKQIARNPSMRDILNTLQVLVGLLASCLSIGAAIMAMTSRSSRYSRQGHPTLSPAPSSQPSGFSPPLTPLDFWEKAEAIGKGILEGSFNGFLAGALTMIVAGMLLCGFFVYMSLLHLAHLSLTIVWVLFALAGLLAMAVGGMGGVVAGVNEARRAADTKRLQARCSQRSHRYEWE